MALPKTLFDTALEFISRNVENIECLDGFPEIIGEKIFDHAIAQSELSLSPSQEKVKIIKVFSTTYKELILKSIDLSNNLMVINEYFDPLVELLHFVTELCLCSCYLGDSHELFEKFQNFSSLKKLCLKNNCLKDGALRKITLPLRMFNKGPNDIEYLNVAGNNFTDNMLPTLSAFSKLKYLEISKSNLTHKGIKILESKCLLKLSNSESEMHSIKTEGWAGTLIQKWNEHLIRRREERDIIKCKTYFAQKRYTIAKEKLSTVPKFDEMSSKSLVFKRVQTESHPGNSMQPTTTKNCFFPDILYKDAIENDIFQQYYCQAIH